MRLRLIIGLLVAVGGFYMLINSMMEGGAYLVTVDQAVAAGKTDKLVRVKGTVVEGSYQNPEGTNQHSFTIHGEDQVMQVEYEGPLPDVFTEGREVVAQGTLTGTTLVANEVTAKCPSKYEEGQISDETRARMEAAKAAGAESPH